MFTKRVKMRTEMTRLLAGVVLFLVHGTARADVIVDQSSGETGQFIQSQDFTDLPAYSAVAFDNFTVGTPLDITSLTVFGREFYGGPSANVAVVAGVYASPELTIPILSVNGTQVGSNLYFDFGGAPLAAGSYWLTAYVVRPNSAGGWYWNLRLPVSGSQAQWHNPGGARGFGTSPVPLGNVLAQADLAFILNGDPTSQVPSATSSPTPTPTPTAISNTPLPSPTVTATSIPTSTSTRTATRTRTPTPMGGTNQQGSGNQSGGGQGGQGQQNN